MESLIRNSCIALVCAIWGSCSNDLKKALSDILWFSRHNIASCNHQSFAVYAGQFNLVLTADFGLGTGLGSAMVVDGIVEPMELGHLPYRKRTFEDYVGVAGRKRLG